jgi:flagellar basal body-associated protein FliL
MGFEPQTAGQPLVNTHRRTTKVNIIMAIAVVVFLLVGAAYIIWADRHAEPVGPPPEASK